MNFKRLLISILLLPVMPVFANQKKDPELLEIPGAEGLSVDYFTDLMSQEAPQLNVGAPQQIPGLNVGAPQQIPLQGIAGLGANELTTQNLLTKFLGTTAKGSEGYKLGMGELKKTLGGEFYDPKTSDFWKGYRETSEMEQEQGVADLRRRGQLGGGLFSTGVAREEAGYVKGMGVERTMQLGALYEKERDRKTHAVGQALGYAGFEEQGTMNRLTAGSTIGAIPRLVENQKLEALFNQIFGQNKADYIQEGKQNESIYAQALGQSEADFAQQQLTNKSKYAQEMTTLTTQTGAAEQLMPQWNIDSSSGESPLGGILGLVGALIGK